MIQKLGFLLLLAVITSCGHDPYKVDINRSKLHVNYLNLDSTFRFSTQGQQRKEFQKLLKTDLDLVEFSFPYALNISIETDSSFYNGLNTTFQHPYTKQIIQSIDKQHKWRLKTFNQIETALKRFQILLPDAKIPSTICFTYTQFAASAYASSKSIVIGQERYLGYNHPMIKALPSQQFFDWIKKGMEPEFASTDGLLVWLSTNVLKSSDENLASEMIRWGKLLAIVEICAPEIQLHKVLRYSPTDLKWALQAERGFWEYIVEQQFLFKTDQELNMNLLNEGPYTIGLPKESPDRMGRFLGYRIVKQYIVAQKPTLKQLINTPYHQILKKYEVPK